MPANVLPNAAAVADLVTMLVGNKVRAVPSTPLPVTAARGLSTYVAATQAVVFVGLLDMAFLAGVGAALAMIPAGVVTDAVKSGQPSQALLDNTLEVMNIVASLFNDVEGKGVHVKLQRLARIPPLPLEIAPRIAKPLERLDLDIFVPGYPTGKLSLLALK